MFEGTRREADPPQYFDVDAIKERFVIGTPDEVAATIRERVAGLPVTDIYTWSDYPGIPDELIDRHLALTFTELAPRLRPD
jgi:alkanesulfonate monooxygenase SsuD/methylene tetrahydromethanopterin reductase-like flavin-dependent oxidoreductase (luciferase family)